MELVFELKVVHVYSWLVDIGALLTCPVTEESDGWLDIVSKKSSLQATVCPVNGVR